MAIFFSAVSVIFLLVLEGFFSGSEAAVLNCDRHRMKILAREGVRGATLVQRMLEEPERLLGTTLLGASLSVVLNSVLLTVGLISGYGSAGILYAILILCPLALFFGEILPRTLFLRKADSLAPRVIFPLWFAAGLFRPLLWVIAALHRTLGRSGLRETGYRAMLPSRDELRDLLEMPKTGSDILAEEERMVDRLMELSESKVHEVMIPLVDVVAVPEMASWEKAARTIIEKGHSRIPVFRDRIDQIVGILHHFDLMRAHERSGTVSTLVRPASYVPETKPVQDLLLDMKKSAERMVVAVDEYGGATGIITLEDIFEEIVGEIDDEYDRTRSFYRKIGPSSYLVDARVEVDYLNERFSINLPEGDYETLGGFLMTRMGRIPKEGEVYRSQNLSLTIEKATARSVQTVRMDIF